MPLICWEFHGLLVGFKLCFFSHVFFGVFNGIYVIFPIFHGIFFFSHGDFDWPSTLSTVKKKWFDAELSAVKHVVESSYMYVMHTCIYIHTAHTHVERQRERDAAILSQCGIRWRYEDGSKPMESP